MTEISDQIKVSFQIGTATDRYIFLNFTRTAMFSACNASMVYNSDLYPMDVVTGDVYPFPQQPWNHDTAVEILPDSRRIFMNGGFGALKVMFQSVL